MTAIKTWVNKAKELLAYCLNPIPQEINELDWKEALSTKNERLSHHLTAFANHPGGGFLVFGIEDKSTKILGINKESANLIVDKLSNICRTNVDPLIRIDHAIEVFDGQPLLFIFIKESSVKPVHLSIGTIEDSYIRSGGSTRKASRQEIGGLMLNSKTPQFEELHASTLKNSTEVISLIDYSGIYRLLKKPVANNPDEIMYWMDQEKMIEKVDDSGYYITNFGALAAGHNLLEFDGLSRKVVRVISYQGKDKSGGSKEFTGSKGYAIGFEGLINFLKNVLPGSEIIKSALRQDTAVYPEIALRELIANALIHQDFSIRGSGPMIEIFDDRIEITNPGRLLPTKKVDRLIRTTPQSRNEILASAFRRYNICEERGSGFEKSVKAIELFGLPPLKIEELENAFRVTLFSPRSFSQMSNEERIEAAYQHSIIQYYGSGGMTNTTLRERFKMNEKQSSQISRLIKDAIDARKIKPRNPESASKKFTLYVPYWA